MAAFDPRIDENLRPYATPRQWEIYCAVHEHGSQRAAARALGCAQNNISQAMISLQRSAATRGYAPDNDMVHPAPPGFMVKGTSTLYDLQTGQARVQWVKTARLLQTPNHADSWIDKAGYTALGAEVAND